MIVFFFFLHDCLASFFSEEKYQNQNVATIGTLLDQFMLSCKEKRLARFSQCLPRT